MRPLPGKVVVAGALGGALSATAGAVLAKKHHGAKQPRGPYPGLGACPVFPKSSAGGSAPPGGDESAWNQDISSAPVDPNSAAYIAYINAHGGDFIHPDFGSPREYGFPLPPGGGGKNRGGGGEKTTKLQKRA